MHWEIEGVPIFAGLQPEALDLLLEQAKRESFAAGSLIVREGETGNRMFIVESGRVRVVKDFGKETSVELVVFGPKDFFGEMCILETLPRIATVEAVTDATTVSFSCFAFHHLYKAMPAQYSILILNIARDLSRRLRRSDEVFASKH